MMQFFNLKAFILVIFVASNVAADPWQHLNQGDQLAQQFLNQSKQRQQEGGSHPFYKGIPNESKLSAEQLKGASSKVAQQDAASQMVIESEEKRGKFKIDPSKDPLLLGSQRVQKNPLQGIGGEGTQLTKVTQGGKDETLTCEEAGELSQHTCTETVTVTIKNQLGPIKYRTWTEVGPVIKVKIKHGWYSYQNTILHKVPYQDTIKTPVISHLNTCGALEEKVDRGLCSYVSRACTQGRQTRFIGGVPVTQNCWEETFTYACEHPSKNDCAPLRARGCVQNGSTCKQKIGNACVVHIQTYQCKSKSQLSTQITGGKTPFCLDGSCRDQSWELNDEMMSSLAQLSILKEMQGKMDSIFKGDQHQCSKYILSFKDCCGSGKGWSKSIGLGGCKEKEKLLQKKRQARLCHYVGTYCAKKVLNKCVQKKSSYCCFGSKLLKAFHVQGRPQISLDWGSPEEPLCRGFTIEEIQRIDFSKLDLSEAFEDLMKNYSPSKLQGTGQKIGERLNTIKQGLVPHSTKQPLQRPDA